MDLAISVSEEEKPIAMQGLRMVQHSKHSLASRGQDRLQRMRLRLEGCSYQKALSLIKAYTPPKTKTKKTTTNPTVDKNMTSLPPRFLKHSPTLSLKYNIYLKEGKKGGKKLYLRKKKIKKRYLPSKVSTD